VHKRNRLEALCQLRTLSEQKGAPLSSSSSALWDTFLAWQEQKWMLEFRDSPACLGSSVWSKVRKWESEVLGKGTRSFADYVHAVVQKLQASAKLSESS
jgi:hypothetical protein